MELLDWHEFDQLISPMINNPQRLFEFLKDGLKVNFYEAFIAMVFFTWRADYDVRIELVFSVFDDDGSKSLDRKETAKLLTSSIFGLAKITGLPVPSKMRVAEYIGELYKYIDADGSGLIEYDELKDFIDINPVIQTFLLRYTGMQTYIRADIIYRQEIRKWKDFFHEIAVDYFGDFFVEYPILVDALRKELQHIDK